MTGLVVAGEDSGKKQVREIQQLLASAPIVVAIPHQAVAQAFRPEGAPLLDATVAAERKDLTPEGVSYSGDNSGSHDSPVPSHASSPLGASQSQPLVLPAV